MRWLAAFALMLAVPAFAQEIGTELPNTQPATPKSSASDYNNPYAQPSNSNTNNNAVPPPPPPTSAPVAGGMVVGHGSAGKGAFGMSASFGGSAGYPISVVGSAGGVPTASGPVSVASFGVGFFVADMIRLTVDLGAGMAFANQTSFGFTGAVGLDIVLKTPADPVRPFITVKVGFAKSVSTASDDFGLNPEVGFGGEYYLSPNFCLSVKALVAMPILLKGNSTVMLVAFSPSVGATVYF